MRQLIQDGIPHANKGLNTKLPAFEGKLEFPLTAEQTLEMIHQQAVGLEALHKDLNTCHGDIDEHCGNVMQNLDANGKLHYTFIDFAMGDSSHCREYDVKYLKGLILQVD